MLKHIGMALKKFIIFLLIIICLLVGFFIYFIHYLDPNKYQTYIIKQIEHSTNGQFKINGDIHIKMLPEPHIELNDSVFYFNLGNNQISVSSKKIHFDVVLKALLKKDVHITALHAKGVTLSIQKERDVNQIHFDSFEGKVAISPCCYKITDFKLKTLDNTLQGDFDILQKDKVIEVNAELLSESWQIQEASHSQETMSELLQFLDPFRVSLKMKVNHLAYEKMVFEDCSFNLTSENHHFKLEPDARWAKGKLSGKIDLMLDSKDIDMGIDLHLKEASVQEVLHFFDQATSLEGSADLHFLGKTRGSSAREWKSNLRGDLKWQAQNVQIDSHNNLQDAALKMQINEGKVKKIQGDLVAKVWRFTESTSAWRLFLDSFTTPIALGVKIEELQFERASFHNVQFQFTSEKGQFTFNPVADFSGGKWVSLFTLFPDKNNPRIDLSISLQNAQANQFMSAFGENKHILSGALNFNLKGSTWGDTLTKWKSGLKGELLLQFSNTKLHPDVKHITNELGEVIRCIVVKSAVQNGILVNKQNIGFDSSRVKGLGSGQYDLNTNQVDYIFEIVTNNKLTLDPSGTVHFIKVSGTLEDPQASITKREVFNQASRITLGILTGGYSLLAERLSDILLQRKSACQTVLQSP